MLDSLIMVEIVIKKAITSALGPLGIEASSATLEHPSSIEHGDYSTNVAMAYAKNLGMNPKELAEKIVMEIENNKPPEIEKVEVAGPGFINFYLSRSFFSGSVEEILNEDELYGRNDILSGKKIMVEYGQPNPFKPFHIGHLMSLAIGESISRIVEFHGAVTIRANYQGDIGPHVAKAIYGLMKNGKPEDGMSVAEQANYIGEKYAEASNLYDTDEEIKKEIDVINKKIYEKSDKEINDFYDWGRKVTLEAFEELYSILGTKYNHYFFESETANDGLEIVRANTGDVFEESDGAIVFHAEKHDPKLHTRVFINSQGLPTYETKELGLTKKKFDLENPDLSIVDTATEQADYMRVVLKAISLLYPELDGKFKHITHGMMRFASGKMSSRKGNVVTGESLIRDSKALVMEKMIEREFDEYTKEEIATVVGVSAIKYSILRSTVGSDIVYDFEKSISFEGDSGPYLQYSATRATSVLEKANTQGMQADCANIPSTIFPIEKHLYKFPEVIVRAGENFEPHHLTTYLTELAGEFNAFYANEKILDKDDEYSAYKIAITEAFLVIMKNGLWLLGIRMPEKM